MLPASVGAMVSERKEEDMSRIKTSLEIGYPLGRTFAYLTDPRNAKEWSDGVGRCDLRRGSHRGNEWGR
jgi:hypothetical protein